MATVQTLVDSIEIQIRDFDNSEMTAARLLILIADASREAGSSGWVRPVSINVDDPGADLQEAVGTGIAWVKDLRRRADDDRDIIIERHYWRMAMNGTNPTFYFEAEWTGKYGAGLALEAEGWDRPTAYTALGATVDAGMEPFLRARAAAHALRTMSSGGSELDRIRAQQSEMRMRDSQVFLDNIPEQFRLAPRARHVPGR